MNTYLMIGERVGTPDARDLAAQLRAWHDAMVNHLRLLKRDGAPCAEDCPHDEARVLWPMALEVFGPQADTLAFLRAHGSRGRSHTMGGGATRPRA